MQEIAIVNPRRRRRRTRATSRRRRRTRARHNPARFFRRRRRSGASSRGMSLAGLPIQTIGLGVAGAVGTELGAAALVKMLPASVQTNNAAKLGVKVGLVVALSMLGRRFVGPGAARALAIGGGIAVGVEAFRTYVMPSIPGLNDLVSDYQLSDYQQGVNGITDGGAIFAPLWSGNTGS